MTKDELFAELKALENKALHLISDDSKQDEFDQVMDDTNALVGVAREKGWIE